MTPYPSAAALYKRVRYLTNIGKHAEASALFDYLQASRLQNIGQHDRMRQEPDA